MKAWIQLLMADSTQDPDADAGTPRHLDNAPPTPAPDGAEVPSAALPWFDGSSADDIPPAILGTGGRYAIDVPPGADGVRGHAFAGCVGLTEVG